MAKDTVTPKAPSRKPATQTTPESTGTLSSIATVKGTVLIANQHTAPIVIPRAAMQGEQRISLPPLVLEPGTITPVDGIEWAIRKELVVIQHYLDRGLLAEVNTVGSVAMDPTSTDLQDAIPENLKSEEELGQTASAKVTKAIVGNVEV